MTTPAHAFWVVCLDAGETSLMLVEKARQLAGGRYPVACVAWGAPEDVPPGADAALLLPEAGGDPCSMGEQLAKVWKDCAPEAVLFPATVVGRAVSAWVAARLGTGLTADCTALSIDAGGLLLQTRPAYGGKLMADILCRDHRPQMASVRPKVLAPSGTKHEATPWTRAEVAAPAYLRRVGIERQDQGCALSEAEVVVAGGKGIGGSEGFLVLAELAGLLGGALGATRSAVDAGFAPYPRQVGLTGRVVRPRLYIAVAIHGAVQHTVGMDGAACVVAINHDPHAPIFRHADYGVVADWRTAVGEMIEELKKERAR